MAINTMDKLVAALAAGRPLTYLKSGAQPTVAAANLHSLWAATGTPGAGSFAVGNTTTGVVPTDATAGAIAFDSASSGNELYVLRAGGYATQQGVLTIYDRVWHAGSFTPTSGSYAGFDGSTVPNRPTDGAFDLFAEINTGLSAAAHTLTVTYHDQSGGTGKSGTIVLAASAPQGRLFRATLAAGDTGVRRLTALSGSASPPTGSFNLFLARRILDLDSLVASAPNDPRDFASIGMPRVRDDACLFGVWWQTTGTTAPTVALNMTLGEG